MRKLIATLAVLALIVLPGCDSFVEGVDEPPDNIADEVLNDASQIPFLMNGVQARFAQSHDQISLAAGLLSDAQVFGRNGDATFPTYRNLDVGDPALNSNTVDNAFNVLGEYRYLADNLIERVNAIDALGEGEGGFDSDAQRDQALYIANLHGGIARYFYAAYFGAQPELGGGVISTIEDKGAFVPSAEMYNLAIGKLTTALDYVDADSYEERVVNSIIARIHLFQGNYGQAATFAEAGLVDGDAPFQSRHNVQSANEWWVQAGLGRLQVVADERFRGYLEENPAEDSRVQLLAIVLADTSNADGDDVGTGTVVEPLAFGADVSEPFQNLYPEQGSPITFVSWQEVELMLAEVALRDGDAAAARTHIDNVRESHGLDALADDATVDLSLLAEERDKEMFAEGIRLIDQRRLDVLEWHLQDGTWRFLPLTQQERNDNPCIPETADEAPDPNCDPAAS